MRLIKSHMQIIPEKVRIIQKMQKKTIDNIIMEKIDRPVRWGITYGKSGRGKRRMEVRRRKMIHKILAVVVSVCMLLTAQPFYGKAVKVQAAEEPAGNADARAVDAGHEGHAGWTAVTANDENAVEWTGGNYYLGNNVTMGTITITGEVTLCLNGKTLTHSGETGSAIVVESGGKFTLCDCKDQWGHAGGFDETTKQSSYTLTGTGGKITGGKGTPVKYTMGQSGTTCYYVGGGVYVKSNAVFFMTGGAIMENDVSVQTDDGQNYTAREYHGGGVYVKDSGAFHMSGGVIAGNKAGSGGGVYVGSPQNDPTTPSAEFHMSGDAVIMNNDGGGCIIMPHKRFDMDGGEIIGNIDEFKGGVEIAKNAIFYMRNGKIEGNRSSAPSFAAGVYLIDDSFAYLSGGSIRYNLNTAQMGNFRAGGVRMTSSATKCKISGGITITDNYVNDSENNVLLTLQATMETVGELSGHIGVMTAKKPNSFSETDTTEPNKPHVTAVWGGAVEEGRTNYQITEEDLSHFSSDEGYAVLLKEDKKTENNRGNVLVIGSDLVVSDAATGEKIALSPTFDINTKFYTATVEHGVSSVAVVPALAKPTTMTIQNADHASAADIADADNIPLAVGVNTIKVTEGDSNTVYTVVITREEIKENPVTVTAYKDGEKWADCPYRHKLTADNGATFVTDLTSVPDGTYKLYSDDTDTGVAVTVVGAAVSARADYYTVTFYDKGTPFTTPAPQIILKGQSASAPERNPTKTGHKFKGWFTQDGGSEEYDFDAKVTKTTSVYAGFEAKVYTITYNKNSGKIENESNYTSYTYGVGLTLPIPTKKGYSFTGWYDNEDLNGDAVANISATDTGDKEYWAKWTDDIAPVIGVLEYSYQPKNLWHWLIGKDSLTITVPVTEEGSGADEIIYTVTPTGGTAKQETAEIKNGKAEITLFPDFKGTVSITCTDKAGNISSGVAVEAGLDADANGIILEDNAPEIVFQAKNAERMQSGEYETAPDIAVTVTDDKDNAVSGGIASVSYQVGDGAVKAVDHDYTTSMVVNDSFTIPASEIPTGETVISVTAKDHAGNSVTERMTIKVHDSSDPSGDMGTVSKDVEKDEKAPDTTLSTSKEELADIILTEEEKAQVENGTDIKFILDVKDAGDTVTSDDKAAVQEALSKSGAAKGFVVGQYLDISLFKVIGADRSAISQTARKLTIVIEVPDSLKSEDIGKPRTYAIICVHEGVAETLVDLDNNDDTITMETDRFSAYAIVYSQAGSGEDDPTTPDDPKPTPMPDDPKPTPTPDDPKPKPPAKEQQPDKEKGSTEIHSGLKGSWKGEKLQVTWGRVTGADGYSVYVQYCGKDFGAKSLNQVKGGKKTKFTVKKVNGQKLDTTKNFKMYVVAWKWRNGKKSALARTLIIHVAGKDSARYTNIRNIQVKKTSYMLKKGGTVTLRPKAILQDKRKLQLSAAHAREFYYLSSNKKVATVTEGGKIKAKGTGSCTIYVLAKDGCKRKIKIKVKK